MKDTQKRPVGLTKYGKIAVGASALIMTTASQAGTITAPDFSDPIANITLVLGAMLGVAALAWGARKLLSFLS